MSFFVRLTKKNINIIHLRGSDVWDFYTVMNFSGDV